MLVLALVVGLNEIINNVFLGTCSDAVVVVAGSWMKIINSTAFKFLHVSQLSGIGNFTRFCLRR